MVNSAVGVPQDLFKQIRGSTAPGMDPAVIEELLRGYFSGKRDSLRTYKLLDVEVRGKRARFKGMVVDISRSGVLLRIMDPTFATAEEQELLMPYTARVWYHFEGGFVLALEDGSICVPAHVVRVTGYCGRGASLIFIGCRFERPLTKKQCKRLGVDWSDDKPPGL